MKNYPVIRENQKLFYWKVIVIKGNFNLALNFSMSCLNCKVETMRAKQEFQNACRD